MTATTYAVQHEYREEFPAEADAVRRAEELRAEGVAATVAMIVTSGRHKSITQVWPTAGETYGGHG